MSQTFKYILIALIGFILALILFKDCSNVNTSKNNLNGLKSIFDSLEVKAKKKNRQIAELRQVNDSLKLAKNKVLLKYITIKDTITLRDSNDVIIYEALTNACDTLINEYERIITNDSVIINNYDSLVVLKNNKIEVQKKEIDLHLADIRKQKKRTVKYALISLGVGVIMGVIVR